jgi:hypothetical protein
LDASIVEEEEEAVGCCCRIAVGDAETVWALEATDEEDTSADVAAESEVAATVGELEILGVNAAKFVS